MTTQLLEKSVPSLLLLTIASFYASCGQKEKKKKQRRSISQIPQRGIVLYLYVKHDTVNGWNMTHFKYTCLLDLYVSIYLYWVLLF